MFPAMTCSASQTIYPRQCLTVKVFVSILLLCFSRTHGENDSLNQSISCNRLDKVSSEVLEYCQGTFRGHVFGVATDAPMAYAFPPANIADLRNFHDIFKDLEVNVRRRRTQRKMHRACGDHFQPDGAITRSEMSEQHRWLSAARNSLQTAGLNPTEFACFTRLYLNGSYSAYLYKHMESVHSGVEQTATKVRADALAMQEASQKSSFQKVLLTWNNSLSMMSDSVETGPFKCTVRNMVGIRRQKQFVFRFKITNAPMKQNMPSGRRHYLMENWMVTNEGELRAIGRPMYSKNVLSPKVNGTTTSHALWSGTQSVSGFFNLPTATGPAMRYLHQVTSSEQDSISDGIFPSNIAILVLPAVLASFTPASIFEHSPSTLKIITFAFLVDSISVLPLGIKGVELVVQTRRNHTWCTSYATGVESDGNAAIELRCATCHHDKYITKFGIAFICTAVCLLVFGILIEAVFLFFSYRRTQPERLYKMLRRRPSVMHHPYSFFCYDCDCQDPTPSQYKLP